MLRLSIRCRELELGPGDVKVLPPGHDAWVIGDEPAVAVDWGGAHVWAKPATETRRAGGRPVRPDSRLSSLRYWDLTEIGCKPPPS